MVVPGCPKPPSGHQALRHGLFQHHPDLEVSIVRRLCSFVLLNVAERQYGRFEDVAGILLVGGVM